MPSCPGIEGCLSMSILTSLTLPLAARTTFSSTGVSCLQGPHHSAQKSTSTGWRLDSSITSFTKVWVVVSLTATSATALAPAFCSISLGPYGYVLDLVVRRRAGGRFGQHPNAQLGQLIQPVKWCPGG